MSKRIILVVFVIAILSMVSLSCSQAVNNAGSSGTDSSKQAGTGTINQAVSPPAGGGIATDTPAVKPAATAVAKISDILQKSSDYIGKDVVIEGKIVAECGAGCWFNLKEGNAVIYVDLAPSNLSIPQKIGSNARVYGVVTIEKKIVYIIGKKVEFI